MSNHIDNDRQFLQEKLAVLTVRWKLLELSKARYGSANFPTYLAFELQEVEREISEISNRIGVTPPFVTPKISPREMILPKIEYQAEREKDLEGLLRDSMEIKDRIRREFTWEQVTIMLTDVKGFTKMMRQKGDIEGAEVVQRQRDILLGIIKNHHGFGKHSAGDAMLAWFQDANDGVYSAIEIQRALSEYNLDQAPEERIFVRIGLNKGEVLITKAEEPFLGDTINIASRVMSRADGGQIFVTEDVYKNVKEQLKKKLKFREEMQLKGAVEPTRIYEVVWHNLDHSGDEKPESHGQIRIYQRRIHVRPHEWEEFYKSTENELDIMTQSDPPIFKSDVDQQLIYDLLRKGRKIRILLFNPREYYFQQFRQIDSGLDFPLDAKIEKTLRIVDEVREKVQGQNYPGALVVKVTNQIMFRAISRSDNRMYVSNYLGQISEGDEAPTFLISAENTRLFQVFRDEFNRMWDSGEFYDPWKSLDPTQRIFFHYGKAKDVRNIILGKNTREKLPFPPMAIIYPTFKCSIGCKNCMYNSIRSYYEGVDIDVALLSHIVDDLSSLGVGAIELSGGGEPLEHSAIKDLLQKVAEIKGQRNDIDFGLISNGLNLQGSILEIAAKNFSYIRLTYSEGMEENARLENRFFNNLSQLVDYCRKEFLDTVVGFKILATKKNKHKLEGLIDRAYESGVSHVKVRAIRATGNVEPTSDEIREIEERLYGYKLHKRATEDLQIDLKKTRFRSKFRCWVNALCPVIDPLGNVFLCYNYHNDHTNTRIGQMTRENSLRDFWGGDRHLKTVTRANVDRICKAAYACNCRLADYQEQIEDAIALEDALNRIINPEAPMNWPKGIQSFL